MIGVREACFLLVLVACVYCVKGLKIRLVNGKHPYEGRIEVFHDERWGDVCDSKWDLKGARVACRMLGYPDAERFTFGDWWGRGSGFFWLDDVACHGDEYSLEICSHKDWGKFDCSDDKTAGVICRDRDETRVLQPVPSNFSKGIVDLPLTLVGLSNNGYISEGLLEVSVNGQPGFVCSKDWSYFNSRVACGMLGYPDAIRGPLVRKKTKWDNLNGFMMGSVKCSGRESSLVQCQRIKWGPLKCHNGFPVYLNCRRSGKMFEHPKTRLRGSFRLWEGRVEVKSKDVKEKLHWGTVCDDHFDMVDANVVCRSLGLGTASRVFTNAKFGQGVQSIYMDEVNCDGFESSLQKCKYSPRSDCTHYEDVSVRCNAPKLHTNEIRLTGGASPLEGAVEIFDGFSWNAVCGENWGLNEAIVTCRQLDLGFANQAVTGNYFGTSRLTVKYSGISCQMNDQSLSQCRRDPPEETACKSNKRAGVICARALPDLAINIEELQESVVVDAVYLSYLRCAKEENCLAASAEKFWKTRHSGHMRRLLRFTTQIENRGLAPFRPNIPQSAWQFHACHNHYHSMEVFSTYELLNYNGQMLGEGHKASFCLEDTVCDKGVSKVFNCTNRAPQGISPNCYDVYRWNIDCQWIDVTDFQHGNYILRVNINAERKVAESDYTNNIAKCWVYDYGSVVYTAKCHLETCESGYRTTGGNSDKACCVFPFKYNGKLIYKCQKFYFGNLWCGTTFDYDKDGKWGYCL